MRRVVALLTGLALLAGCSADPASPAPTAPVPDAKPVAKITADPAPAAKNVEVTKAVTVRIADGELDTVALTNPQGKQVEGEFAADRRSWHTTEDLGFGKSYSYAAKGTGTDGKPVQLAGKFTTVSPASTIRATVNPVDDAVVGVGMPISVKFDRPPADRAAAEKALAVETSPTEVEGSWAWIKPTQVDWRPKQYWPAHTKVKVSANLYGVKYGDGAYGKADVTSEFAIGRNQVVKVHTPDHEMNVYRDGAKVASYPSSNGRDADPNLNTPNGTLIVMTREPVGDFSNPRYGYTNVKKKWSVRISNHGEYIHENEENAANIGKANTSHGCVNLREDDAKAYFDSALIGDPVEITGSKAKMPRTSDVFDWLIPWSEWQAMSALR
ncbi:lipoprotein-anchoring transpeptidase ErfK/SrfK [Labedaea rhizosphaerae]|uniref:Lipoprotein-anchoring transpeptidase ErfK/SrfK n=1 Tax=Labedaea rhizosphaerae TaxID=598644 RepID=A0A4R6SNK8_LABRH|nr:lipoprotein-anchoring transpeptidase ErfK/SrfK [Labedaea rhizosphaerae]